MQNLNVMAANRKNTLSETKAYSLGISGEASCSKFTEVVQIIA